MASCIIKIATSKLMLLFFLIIPFSKILFAQEPVESDLYIFHNGKDTLIKNYELVTLLKLAQIEKGVKIIDEEWVPDPESSTFNYYQVFNKEYLYFKWSTYFDSNVIELFNSGKLISDMKIILTPIDGDSNIFYSIEQVVNKEERIKDTYYFTKDSLRVVTEFMIRKQDPIKITHSYRYTGQ